MNVKKMDADKYLKERLEDRIDWYDRKSNSNQKWFKRLRFAEILIAATIPFLSGHISLGSYIPIIIGLMGVGIAVIAGVLAISKFQENWIEYRTICESLEKEKILFLTRIEPYNVEDAFELLVQRAETLLSKENTNWAQRMIKPKKENDNKLKANSEF